MQTQEHKTIKCIFPSYITLRPYMNLYVFYFDFIIFFEPTESKDPIHLT